ncbi:hypothetical protein SCHPADRAFT_561913 [Schizopora paradoxa]|uniref:Uncharacterized protein n=1 Tax=Schizopora paradoxa TaxID=27342 RepID=A0A0H2RCK5_9AGAM|nr:hypothetical protein SCHPADRAFT_561913 [Schizopora paradoxa]
MASSRRQQPPQLQLAFSTPPHQSFKRSFQQFGLDVDSPQSAGGSSSDATSQANNNFAASASSSSDGNERNKRARSEARSVEYGGETSGPSSAVEDERYRPMIPEFTEDTMEGIEVGSSGSSSTLASGSSSSANVSTVNSSMNSSFESNSLFAPRPFEETAREAVMEPQGVPVNGRTDRRRLLDLPSFRARSVQRLRERPPTLPAFEDTSRPLLHPALRARPSSPVMTAPTTHSSTAARSVSGPSAPPSDAPYGSWTSNAFERARAFHESLEPLRRAPDNISSLPSASRMQQQQSQTGPRPRVRELHPDQLPRFDDGADSDGEDLDLPPVFNDYGGRERLLSVGNPVIPMIPTSPDVELSAFSVAPLESASRPGPGTASSMLRRRLETASQQAEHGSPPRRLPRLQQTRAPSFSSQSSTQQAPALYPSSTWSRDVLQGSQESSVVPTLNALHDNVSSLMDEINSPSNPRMDQRGQQRLDSLSAQQDSSYFRAIQGQQDSMADLDFRSDPTLRQVRRRPRTLLNRSSSPPPPRPTSSTTTTQSQSQNEPAAALRRLLQNVRATTPPLPEPPRFESLFSSGGVQRERVLPPPITTSGSGRQSSVRPASAALATSDADREMFSRYAALQSGLVADAATRSRAASASSSAVRNSTEMRSSSRMLRRPSLLNPARERESASMRNLPDLFSVYDEGVEREADHLARLSTLPGIRSPGGIFMCLSVRDLINGSFIVDSHSPTFEEELVPWGRALRNENTNNSMSEGETPPALLFSKSRN